MGSAMMPRRRWATRAMGKIQGRGRQNSRAVKRIPGASTTARATGNVGSAVTRIRTAKTIETNPPRTRTCSKLHARQPVGPIPPDIPFPDVASPYVCGESIRSPPARLVRDELGEITLLRFGVPVGSEAWAGQCYRREATGDLFPRVSVRENRIKPRKAVHPTQG